LEADDSAGRSRGCIIFAHVRRDFKLPPDAANVLSLAWRCQDKPIGLRQFAIARLLVLAGLPLAYPTNMVLQLARSLKSRERRSKVSPLTRSPTLLLRLVLNHVCHFRQPLPGERLGEP